MELENIILSEVSQAQMTKNCMWLDLDHVTREEHIPEIRE
jgi:hypothetical protein